MANTRKVVVEVTDNGTLKQVAGEARKLNDVLDRTAQPRKVQSRAASAALSASGGGIGGGGVPPTTEGLGRGTAAGFGRGDTRDFGRQAQGLGGLVHLYATFAANIYAVTAAFNAMSKAADFTNMQKAADILSLKVGISINGLAKDMQKATDGAISMSEALSNASLATSAGLNTKQIKELTSVAKGASIALGRDLTDAMTRVFRGTIKIEPELLDELGLMVKVDDANKAYAKTLNKTVSSLTDYERRQAFVNAVTEQGIRKYKELADQTANPFSKLAASLKDISTDVLTTINSILGPLVNVLSQSPTALLLGMTAIVGLLLKQAIPAIGDMQSAWEASDRAAQESLSKQRKALEDQKSAVLALNEAKVKAAQQKFVETRDTAIQGLESSGIKKSKLKGIDDAAKLGNFIGLSEEQIKTQTEIVRKELEKARGTIEREIAKTQDILDRQGKKSGKTFLNAQAEIGRLNNQLAAISNFENQGLQAISGAATAQALVQKNLMTTDTEITNLTQKIGKFEQMGQRLAVIRGAVQATEAGGFRLGFADLFDSIKKGTGQFDEFGNVVEGTGRKFGTLEKINMGLKGSFQVLTVGVSRLLGTFSIWAAVFTVMIPLISFLGGKLGLVSDAIEKLNEATENLNSTNKLFLDIQEKLTKTGSLAEQYDLQGASATALANSIAAVIEQQQKLDKLREKGTALDKISGGVSMAFGIGAFDKDSELNTIKVYDDLVKKGLIPDKDTLKVFTAKASASGLTFDKNPGMEKLTAESFERADSFEQTNVAELVRKQIGKLDPKLIESFKEFGESTIAMKNNLKDLDTTASEHLLTLQNQSKHLKALNSLSSSTSNLFKQLSSPAGGLANISQYLNGITDQFQEMAQIRLEPKLESFKQLLNTNEAEVTKKFDEDVRKAEGDKKLISSAEDARTKALAEGSASAAQAAGFKNLTDANISLAKYSVKASESLANLAAAAANASVAQAALAASLKKTQFLAGLSSRSTGALASAEYKTEARKVAIDNAAKQTNIKSLQEQRRIDTENLRGILGPLANFSNSTQLKGQAYSKLTSPDTQEDKRGNIAAALGRLAGIEGAISIAQADIKVNTLSLPSKLQSTLDPQLKLIQDKLAARNKATEIETTDKVLKLEEEFSGLVGVGSETIDSLYAYKVAMNQNEAESLKLVNSTKALEDTFKLLDDNLKDRRGFTPEQNTAADSALKEAGQNVISSKQAQQKTAQEGTKLTREFELEENLKKLKETNILKVRSSEIDEISGRTSSEANSILQIRLALEEDIYKAQEQAFATQNATLLLEIAKKEAAAEHNIAVIKLNQELRIQSETLERIDSLFGSNKASTGLLNADQINTINQAYTEILAKQQQISQDKIDRELTGNEKLIAQEALRVEYLEKALELQERTLEAKEKATLPYQLDKDLLAERFKLDAKKFRDTLDSYNKTVVNASYKAVDTFVDGIGNAVKNLDFNLKNIIRDTVFAFDDMMMEYAGNQLKAMMKDAIAGMFGKPDMFKSPAEIAAAKAAAEAKAIAEKQAGDISTLKDEAVNKHTTLFDKMVNLLQRIADAISGNKAQPNTNALAGIGEGALQQLDYKFTEQGTMLASQTAGFTPSELFAAGGTQADIIAAQNAEFDTLASVSSTFSDSTENFTTGTLSITEAFGGHMDSFGGYMDSFRDTTQLIGQNLDSFTQSLFSSSGGGGSSGGLLGGLGSLFGMGGGTTSASMFASQEAGFSAADLASWGGSMMGFATGGAFNVGGQGGTDSKLVQFMATPGEQVIVKTPEQQKESGGATTVHVVNHFTINGPTSRESQQQISAKVGASIQRAMARNN